MYQYIYVPIFICGHEATSSNRKNNVADTSGNRALSYRQCEEHSNLRETSSTVKGARWGGLASDYDGS